MPHRNGSRPRAAFAIVLIAAVAELVVGCSSSSARASGSIGATPSSGPTFDVSGFHLTSSAYSNGGDIPTRYTCYGDSVSPPLAWVGAPADTKVFALIMEDYSAQITHWVAYDIAGSVSGAVPENDAKTKGALSQAVPYMGPCPPAGSRNDYVITIFALSAPLPSKSYQTRLDVENAMAGKVIAQTELSGWYQNQ